MPRPRLLLTALTSLALVAAATGLLRHYHIGVSNDSDVAEWAAATGRGPEECLRIIPIDIFPRPTAEQIRSRCVRRYAELTHDPSACELLMPSRYGLNCVSAALSERRPCALGIKETVSASGGFRASLAECVNGPDSIRSNACCTVAKVSFLTTFNDCSSVSGKPEVSDQCYHELAFKNHDPAACEPIQNPTLKSACLVQSRALRQNPSICQGCIPPVESVDDLR